MTASLRPELLKRYVDIARVIVRNGGHDLIRSSGLSDALGEPVDTRHERDADGSTDLADDLESLGPTFVKLGQLLATRTDLLSPEKIDALARLQDDVDPVPFELIREVVEAELDAELLQLFRSFDEEPLASASLGQVHHAVLHDGREVAVKVQRPGIRDQTERDLDALTGIASFLDEHTDAGEQFRFVEIVEEFQRSLARELDYRREAVGLDELARNLAGFPQLVVPETVPELTTVRVLTMSFIDGQKVTELSGPRRNGVNGEALVDELIRAYLKQMLADGFVHADPHPGNVLLTRDHRLALIDVGMVVRIESATRERLLRLLLAMADGKGDDAAAVAIELGQPTSFFDESTFRRDVATLVGSYQDLPPEHTAVGSLLREVTRISGQDGVRPPAELALLARTLAALDQVARALAPGFDVDAVVRRHAAEVLTSGMLHQLSPSSLLRGVLETKQFAEQLPGRLNRILSSLAEGSLRVRVDAVDADSLLTTLQRVGNRITAGLVLAALIVGAAMLARVETQATIFGYPALALVFFVVASVLGLWLVIGILRGDD